MADAADVERPVDGTTLTCVVVTYNGVRHVSPCLQSLLDGGVRPEAILVVDNASSDGTVELIRRRFPAVRLLPIARNVGYGEGANLGAAVGNARYVAILNQDVVVAPGCVERLVSALEAEPSALLANPKILLKDAPERINTCGNVPHYTGITTCRDYNRPASEYLASEEIPAISGAAFVARRAAFDALGGFDPTFFLYLEDTDLSLRAMLAGYRCLLVPEAVAFHEFEPRFAPEKLFWLERNRLVMLLKTYRWPTLFALAPSLLLAEVLVLGYSGLRGWSAVAAKLRAYGWVATHLPRILRARRAVQALRRVPDRAILARHARDLDLDELRHPLGQLGMKLVNPQFRGWFHVLEVAAT
ncbi:MAG: glycosyltransferase family 2 protein [Chloroflexota bacterium]|nr:glycosyltransferase family 2 protein [Chloroflexota bacterium]